MANFCPVVLRTSIAAGILLLLAGCKSETPAPLVSSPASAPVVVATPARAGAVEGTTDNSDAFIWKLFLQFTAPVSPANPKPVIFETWATDEDTFSTKPHWPDKVEEKKFHVSVLQLAKMLQPMEAAQRSLKAFKIDVKCNPPQGGAVVGFPTSGTPTPCIAEQVARNRAQYDYIVNNHLNTQTGLATAYKNGVKVDMPTEAVAVKGDWIPLPALLQWIPALGSLDNIRRLYYTTTSSGVEYALLSMHVTSRQNPDWVWGTFEHEKNPGRCDYMGCFDTFGAEKPEVLPNKAEFNTQYGDCIKTPQLRELMAKANLSSVWQHYCMKSTQVNYTAADGTPYVLGNSVIEGVVGNGTVAASSCIACHAYASFGANGAPTTAAQLILPFNPTGKTIQSVLKDSKTYSFNWGLLAAPK